MLICDHQFLACHYMAIGMRWMKPVITDKQPCYLMYIKANLHLLLYNCSITDIEHSPNYTAFGLPLTHQVR